MWPELNSRVNCPLKYALVEQDNNGTIDMQNEMQKFCFSCNTTGSKFWVGYSC